MNLTIEQRHRQRRLGDLLVDMGYLSEQQLAQALRLKQTIGARRKFGDLLVSLGFVEPHHVAAALALQRKRDPQFLHPDPVDSSGLRFPAPAAL